MKKLLYILIVFAVVLATLGASAVGSPVLAASPTKPTLSSPGNGSSWPQPTVIELKWNSVPGATQYKVELWGGPYTLMVPCNWIGGTSCWIGTMWPGTMYWHVKARNGTGESDWSDTWSFVIQNGGNPLPTGTPPPIGPTPPPVPPSYQVTVPCVSKPKPKPEEVDVTQPDGSTKKEHSIIFTIPPESGEPQPDKVYTNQQDLNNYIKELRDLQERFKEKPLIEWVANWTVQKTADNMPPLGPREWRVLVVGRVVDYWALVPPISISGRIAPNWNYGRYRSTYLNNPGDLVYLMCKKQVTPIIYDQFLPILNGLAIASPASGAQLTYQVEIPDWMPYIQTSLNIGSKATITLIAPDGTVYSPTNSAVTYVDTPSFAVHTLNLDSPKGGTWQVVIDVIAAESDSVFMLNVNGKQINEPSNDNIPPVTGMHFDGTKGLNGWFTSNVAVTLSAADNPDGSGVKGIEWSIDNGATWQEYTNPFVISQEGLSYVLARSYDNAGNYDQSPIGKFLSIDKTPPVTTLSLDGTLGNNGWYVSNVTGSLSATDNMSGVGATYYSIDGGSITPSTAFTLENDGIHTIQFYSLDNAGNIESTQTATIKVDKTPPVVNVSTDQLEYTRVQPFVVHYTCTDPQPGSGIANCTATFNNQSVQDGQTMDLFWLDLGLYSVNARGEDNAGWVTTKSASFQLIATIESLQATVDRLCKENYITNKGVCNSLRQKLDAALAARNRGQTNAAVNILQALQNEVNAQTGKAIKPEAARMLLMDSSYVIQSLR